MKILVTGSAGFIGSHVVQALCRRGDEVVGLDSINDYYDTQLKHDRLREAGIDSAALKPGVFCTSTRFPGYRFVQGAIQDAALVFRLFSEERFDMVCHLAAQAGVRYSIEAPLTYVASNVEGFTVMLEAAIKHPVKHFVYASTSSVFGLNTDMPYRCEQSANHPVSLYAATKKANELFAHAYSNLHGLPTTGLRFFTVYGPWGRPDMSPYLFARAILEGKALQMFNHGDMQRDFTYIDDIAEGVVRVLDHPARPNPVWDPLAPDPATSSAPYAVHNIGRGQPVKLTDFIDCMAKACGKPAIIVPRDMQAGDVQATWADTASLQQLCSWSPTVELSEGIASYIAWFREYYQI